MAAGIEVQSLSETIAKMQRMGYTLRKETIDPALLGGAEDIAAGVRSEAGRLRQSGAMYESINAKPLAGGGAVVKIDMDKISKVDSSGRKVRYPYFVNYGTVPYDVVAANAKALRLRTIFHGHRFLRSIHHPGVVGVFFFEKGVAKSAPGSGRRVERQLGLAMRNLGAEVAA